MASAGRPALTPNPSPDSFLAGEGSTAFLLDQHATPSMCQRKTLIAPAELWLKRQSDRLRR